MKSVISATNNLYYSFPLPFTIYSWNKIGIDCIIFTPNTTSELLNIAKDYITKNNLFYTFKAPEYKEATYAQVSRLFGCCLDLPEDEVLVTGDADLCVFGDFLKQGQDKKIHVFGNDLTPQEQLPICFLSATVNDWRSIMWAPPGFGYQFLLDELLGPIECEHFKANQWCFDQNLAYINFKRSGASINMHPRAIPGKQFATRRADRDGWPQIIPPDIIDAHLPRPGYTPENFSKILNLFQTMYPEDDFTWMIDYRNEYVKHLDK